MPPKKRTYSFFIPYFLLLILVSSFSYPKEEKPYLVILGITQVAGYPQIGCDKECCKKVYEKEAVGTNFLGTTDSVPVITKTNNPERMRVAVAGNVGIGTSTPTAQLHTVGTVRHASLGTASIDTTTYKPLGINSSGDVIGMTSWPVGTGGGSGTGNTSFPAGSVIFSNSTALSHDANFLWDSAHTRLSLGDTTGIITNATLHVIDATSGGDPHGITEDHYSGDSNPPSITFRKARGTQGSPTAISSGDYIFTLNGYGHDGVAWVNTSYGNQVRIRGWATENWSVGAHGADMFFITTDIGTTAYTRSLYLKGNGNVGIGMGTSDVPGALLDVGVAGTKLGVIRLAGSTSGNVSIQPNAIAGSGVVLTLPSVTGTFSTLDGTETLTNKIIGNTNTVTLKSSLFTIQDASDITKQAVFDVSLISTGTTRTYTLPDSNTTLVGTTTVQTLGGKRITARVDSTTSSATPTINTDNVDTYMLTAQAADITSFTTNLSGTPTVDQPLHIIIIGTAARAISWGPSFEASTIALPTTTVTTNQLDVFFIYNIHTGKWRCSGSF